MRFQMDDQHGMKGGDAATDRDHGAAVGLTLMVNGQSVTVSGKADGRAVLEASGHRRADEHVLVRATHPGSCAIGLDERIGHTGGEFYAFRSDRTFNLTIDDRGYVWGASKLAVSLARSLAGFGDELALFQVVKGGPDRELDDGGDIDLGGGGTEHLRSGKATVPVWIDGVEKHIPRGTYTTEQLIAALGVEAGYLLNVVDKDGQLVPLKAGERVKVRKGTKFISQVPCGGSA